MKVTCEDPKENETAQPNNIVWREFLVMCCAQNRDAPSNMRKSLLGPVRNVDSMFSFSSRGPSIAETDPSRRRAEGGKS